MSHSKFSLELCDSCGACSCVCPMRVIYPDFDRKSAPRAIVHMTKVKTKDRRALNNALWLCFTCDACGEVCPQGVKFRDFVESERKQVIASGKDTKLAKCLMCRRAYIPLPVLKVLKSKIKSPEYQRLLDYCSACRQRVLVKPILPGNKLGK